MAEVKRRYFARVGSELIPVAAEDVPSHGAKGGSFTTSAPVRHYIIRQDTPTNTYEGMGATWKDAEADLDSQLPKVTK